MILNLKDPHPSSTIIASINLWLILNHYKSTKTKLSKGLLKLKLRHILFASLVSKSKQHFRSKS